MHVVWLSDATLPISSRGPHTGSAQREWTCWKFLQTQLIVSPPSALPDMVSCVAEVPTVRDEIAVPEDTVQLGKRHPMSFRN